MAEPTIQWLFDTQIVDGTLAGEGVDDARLIATAIDMVGRYTVDVAHPAVPRFRWVGTMTTVTTPHVVAAPGAFCVLAVSHIQDGSHLVLDDPRMALAATPRGLRFKQPTGDLPGTPERFSAVTNGFVLYPAFLRAEIVTAVPSCRWSFVSIFPQRL